jgi:hypothetical protein
MKAVLAYSMIWLMIGCIEERGQPYDLAELGSLQKLDTTDTDLLLSDYLLVFYFQGTDCDSCINRELLSIGDLLAEAHPRLSGVIVTHYDESSGHIPVMLRDLRRIGRLDCPVLLEERPGQAGLGKRILVALIDTKKGTIEASYHPEFSRNEWPGFEAAVMERIFEDM